MLTYSVSMRGMKEKTVEMDRKLAAISSTMVEFVSGIGVVKAFGRVGRAHSAYLTAADEFSAFYRAWAMPLVTVTCLSFTWVSIPVLLLVNLGDGALLIHAGAVTLPQVLATTLVALGPARRAHHHRLDLLVLPDGRSGGSAPVRGPRHPRSARCRPS
ncbi:Uncharacterised protein [Actinomyces viscosus]|uniref:ABC transmembrane type-1 domain-containing protein n=1 Tax=Actinomyces viscosus TaxID=1656 RepID=A0A3S4VC03_ACTVI|nr:Uncharacterised protein [Actinomyces viscosus]